MKTFIAEESFWSLFPKAKLGVIICKEIDNEIKNEERYHDMIKEAEKEALNLLSKEDFSSNPIISVWRDAFKRFPTKKGARSSIENLLKRVHKGNHIGNINPLVDIYNSISLKYGLPCGGEDIDKFEGNIRLTTAKGDESFLPLGEEENKPPREGEIVYKDDNGIICRCLNWREAERTMLTEETKNAFLIIESIDDSREDVFNKAIVELNDLVTEYLNGECTLDILDNNSREIKIG